MSYDKPYRGSRKRYRDDYEDRRREVLESPQEKAKTAVLKLGEVDAMEELPRLEEQIRSVTNINITELAETVHFAVTEQPYKIPFYAALIRRLYRHVDDLGSTSQGTIGRQLLEDFWRGFQTYLDKLAWRETRYCIHFFAHLTVAGVVTPESMVHLLQSFTSVLEEFGVSQERAKHAALCAAEGFMVAGIVLNPSFGAEVLEAISSLESYHETASTAKSLVNPVMHLHELSVTSEHVDELLDCLLVSLKSLRSSNFDNVSDSFIRPYADYDLDIEEVPFTLPSILVPPEAIDFEALPNDEESDGQLKREEWPTYFVRLFDDDVTPNPRTPRGYYTRSSLISIIDIFEVNRKECARLLLEYPKWTLPGSFKSRPGAPNDSEVAPENGWQLESTIVETILGLLFLLPYAPHRAVYYMGLVTELCKLSPTTVGPAVGKSIRKLYSTLSDGLDVEIARRFAEWFSVHMSNFGFQWVWKEWIVDLTLCGSHPKRRFMQRALELEIRLSYYDRVLKTLPEQMQTPDAQTLPATAPGPNFEYDDPGHPHHEAAQSVLNLLRGRAKVEDVISHLDSLKSNLETSEEAHIDIDRVVRSIALQSLLNIGSRSFSHLLNAIERYLPLLRNIACGSTSSAGGVATAESKEEILSTAALFWKSNLQMVAIVFDKLMQYQIVDPTDVVSWTFTNSASGTITSGHGLNWDLLKGAIDKANGRVVIARAKVAALQKEEDDTRAREKAGAEMEIDADSKPDEVFNDNPALTNALKGFSSLKREQKATLSAALQGFVTRLKPVNEDPSRGSIIAEDAWHNRMNWGAAEWETWNMWGWYRHFCRTYSPCLRGYNKTLTAISFAPFEGSQDPSALLLQKIFSLASSQDT